MLYVTEKKKSNFFFRINLAAINKDIDSCYRIKYSITVNAEGWKRTCEVYHLLLVQRYMKHSSHKSLSNLLVNIANSQDQVECDA